MRLRQFIVVGLLILMAGGGADGQAVRIDITGTADTRVLVAAPDFVSPVELEPAAREMAQVLEYDLLFTGLFKTLPPEKYPSRFTGFTQDATEVDFTAWRLTHAEYLVHAHVFTEGNTLVAECRMFDVETGTQVVGRRLSAKRDFARLVAHRFSEEVVHKIHGVPGIGSSQICFSGGSGQTKEIYVADYDGANALQVTKHNSISIRPKFSPDGTKIAYLSYKDRYPFLYVLDLATGKSAPLSKHVGLNASPAWSPDGKTLAVVLSKDGNTEIYLKNPDGSGERRLTDNRVGDTSPTFDPTGTKLAFVSDRGGKPQIYVMDADGTKSRRVSYQGGNAYDPVWSPDGKKIAYVAERPGEGLEIYVMDADGKNPIRLTDSPGANESPSWSADSRHLMFASTRGGKDALWTVNVEPPYYCRPITRTDLRCQGPWWGPRR